MCQPQIEMALRDFICKQQIAVGTAGLHVPAPDRSDANFPVGFAFQKSHPQVYPQQPFSCSFATFLIGCGGPSSDAKPVGKLLAVGTAGLHLPATDRSGRCRTSAASFISQWALPDFICQLQIAVGTAGLHLPATDRSGHCRASGAKGGPVLLRVGIWQDGNDSNGIIQTLQQAVGQVVLLQGVRSLYDSKNDPPLDLNTTRNARAIVDAMSPRAQVLLKMPDARKNTENVQVLSSFSLRDSVSQEAALQMVGEDGLTSEDLVARHEARDLEFVPCNLKVAKQGGGASADKHYLVIGKAEPYDWKVSIPPAAKYAFKPLMGLKGGHGRYMVGKIAVLTQQPHYGLCIESVHDRTPLPASRVLVLVCGTDRSASEPHGSGKCITTKVSDPFSENQAKAFFLRTFCDETKELDFKVDRNYAVCMVTGVSDKFLDVEGIWLIPKPDVQAVKSNIESLLTMSQYVADQAHGVVIAQNLVETPPSKRCRVLKEWASNTDFPGL
eukprot:s1620_g5.t1